MMLSILSIACVDSRSLASQDALSTFFDKKEVRIVLTDSGLGGLSIMADCVEKLREMKVFQKVNFSFANALFTEDGGYNSLSSREEKIRIFDSALEGIAAHTHPDLILIGCNTLSVLYPETLFSRKSRIPVIGIVDYGVNAIAEHLKADPEATVLLFGTQTTIDEDTHREKLKERGFLPERIITQACPELASYIENGFDSDETEMLIFAYVDEAVHKMEKRPDHLTISLNCSHFGYSLPLWRKALEGLGIPPQAVIDPNKDMASFFDRKEWRERYPQTEIHTKVISMVEVGPQKRDSIGRALIRKSKATARALFEYERVPDLFVWKKTGSDPSVSQPLGDHPGSQGSISR